MDGRQAFGPRKKRTLAEKARNVAESIYAKEQANIPWRWEHYNLEYNEAQIIRVWEVLELLRARLDKVA